MSDTPVQEEQRVGLRWEDPPAGRGRQVSLPWTVWARLLRRRPGQWARLREFNARSSAGNTANRIRKGGVAAFPPDQYEVASRRTETGSVLYGRYIGDDQQ